MAHILWTILKIILIILGIILGLLLLMVLLLLFCPVRYRLHVAKTEEALFKDTSGEAIISWLFGGISFMLSCQQREMHTSIRLFGIPLDKLLNKLTGKKKSTPSVKEKPELKEEDSLTTDTPEIPEFLETEEAKAEQSMEKPSVTEKTKSKEELPSEVPDPGTEELQTIQHSEEVSNPESFEDYSGQSPKPVEKSGLTDRIRAISSKIREKINSIAEKIRSTWLKISWWKDFLTNERTQDAIHLLLQEVKFCIIHILPTKAWGHAAFGFEDPSLTGRITGALAMTIPFHKNAVKVTPYFECRTFAEGDITIKGRIYGVVFVAAALKLLVSKNVRYVIRKLRQRNKPAIQKEE